jgi:hypothetical protein
VNGVSAPQITDLCSLVVVEHRAQPEHAVGANHSEIVDPFGEQRVPDGLPEPENGCAKIGQIGAGRVVDVMIRVVAARLQPVTSEGGEEQFARLTQCLEEWCQQAHHLLYGVLVGYLE